MGSEFSKESQIFLSKEIDFTVVSNIIDIIGISIKNILNIFLSIVNTSLIY